MEFCLLKKLRNASELIIPLLFLNMLQTREEFDSVQENLFYLSLEFLKRRVCLEHKLIQIKPSKSVEDDSLFL